MAFHDNNIVDVGTDLRFGRAYSSLALLSKVLLTAFCIFNVSESLSGPSAVADLVDFLLAPAVLGLQVLLIVGSVYLAKRSSGHERSLSLPHHTKPIRGDPTKGPFIRRSVLRIKAIIFRISPLKTVLHGFLILVAVWILAVYVIVCFGAPALSDHIETATFSFLLVILSSLPIVLIYGPETDASGGLTHVLLSQQDELKLTDPLARQLFVNFFGAVFGAWVGAFPIPLDWDRPWQRWPISCAAGAMAGALFANLFSFFQFHFELKRYEKSSSNPKKKKT